MNDRAAPPALSSISPCFIVSDVSPSIAFYRDGLGFALTLLSPEDAPFFAILRRGGAQLMIKAILPDVHPMPNHTRHPWARWDAFVYAPDPDALAAELSGRGVSMHAPLEDTIDGLRGFEVQDPDGYVLFVGRPLSEGPESNGETAASAPDRHDPAAPATK